MKKTLLYAYQFKGSLLLVGGFLAADMYFPFYQRKTANEKPDNTEDISRVEVPAFKGLKERFKEIKFNFHNISGIEWKGILFGKSFDDYWIDGAAYDISNKKFSEVITATYELHNMCLEATDLAIGDDEILQKVFDIPSDLIPLIRQSWARREVDLMSRYDFLMNRSGQLLFLECNGDTPSGILEAGPAQREWAKFTGLSQFNTLESCLLEGFQRILSKTNKKNICFFNNSNLEDDSTQQFLQELVSGQQGQSPQGSSSIQTRTENISQFDLCVIPREYNSTLFWRQYPLEWLASETPRTIFQSKDFVNHPVQLMLEPAWKIIMSNKAMSVLLKVMYPNSKLLIDTQLQPFELDSQNVLSKQKYAREGEHIAFCNNIEETEKKEFLKSAFLGYVYPPIFQRFIPSDLHSTRYITISSWIVHGKPCGLLFREDLNKIIGTGSSVIPYFLGDIEGSQIQIQLENSRSSSQLRQSIYGQQSINSNLSNISLEESSKYLKDYDRQDFRVVKRNILEQYDQLVKAQQVIFEIPKNQLNDDQAWDRDNVILIGFLPFQGDMKQAGSIGSENSEHSNYSSGRYYCGGSGGGYWGGLPSSSSVNSATNNSSSSSSGEEAARKVSPHQAGTTGRTASAHS